MTVKVANQTKYYLGLSTDTKPDIDDCGANSRFYETDTDRKWVFDGSDWYESAEIVKTDLNTLVKAGKYFTCRKAQASITTDGTSFMITTTSGYKAYINYQVTASNGCTTAIYEDVDSITSSGTGIDFNDRNRSTDNSCNTTAYYGTTFSGGASLGSMYQLYTRETDRRSGYEWVLDEDSYMIINVIPDATSKVGFMVNLFEVEV